MKVECLLKSKLALKHDFLLPIALKCKTQKARKVQLASNLLLNNRNLNVIQLFLFKKTPRPNHLQIIYVLKIFSLRVFNTR